MQDAGTKLVTNWAKTVYTLEGNADRQLGSKLQLSG